MIFGSFSNPVSSHNFQNCWLHFLLSLPHLSPYQKLKKKFDVSFSFWDIWNFQFFSKKKIHNKLASTVPYRWSPITLPTKKKILNISYWFLFFKLYYIYFWCPLILEPKRFFFLSKNCSIKFRKFSYTTFLKSKLWEILRTLRCNFGKTNLLSAK